MKVFKVWVERCGYDEYDAAIIVGETAKQVLSKFLHKTYQTRILPHGKKQTVFYREYDCNGRVVFSKSQGRIYIKEVDTNVEGVVLASYNAG